MRKLKPLVDRVSNSLVRPKFEKCIFKDRWLTYYINKSNVNPKSFDITVTSNNTSSIILKTDDISLEEIRKIVRTSCKPYLMIKS